MPDDEIQAVNGEEDPEELGQSYAGFADQSSWDLDVPAGESPELASEETTEGLAAPPPPERILEALLFVGGAPLTSDQACKIIRGLTVGQFQEAIDTLNQTYRRQGRPYGIQVQGAGYVLTLKPKFNNVVERLYGGIREARLSTQTIDVLALVAYRQPATKAEIDSIRGAESGPLLRQLVRRGLIQVVHRADADKKEVSYGTTERFLKFFGLESLEDLPRTQDLQQL